MEYKATEKKRRTQTSNWYSDRAKINANRQCYASWTFISSLSVVEWINGKSPKWNGYLDESTTQISVRKTFPTGIVIDDITADISHRPRWTDSNIDEQQSVWCSNFPNTLNALHANEANEATKAHKLTQNWISVFESYCACCSPQSNIGYQRDGKDIFRVQR